MSKNDPFASVTPETRHSSVLEHLEALRNTLLKIVSVFALCSIPAWIFSDEILNRLLAFAAPPEFKLHYFKLMEPFFVRLELTMVTALAASFPFMLYFIWQFILPALREHERKALGTILFFPIILGLAGAAVALFFMVPAVVKFSLSFAETTISPVIGIGNFVSLVLGMLLAGMVMFQFPIIIYGLLASGVVTLQTMQSKRPVFIVIILLIAALLTPPDVASQLLLAIPAWLLFELSLVIFALKKNT